METKHILWVLAGVAIAGGAYYWWSTSRKAVPATTPAGLPQGSPIASDPASLTPPTDSGVPWVNPIDASAQQARADKAAQRVRDAATSFVAPAYLRPGE